MRSYDLVNRSTQVSLQAEKFFLSLRDASVDFRNYLRLHDSASLTEFNEDINEYPEMLSLLRTLEIDNPQQLRKLEQINKLASDYVVYVRSLVKMDKTSPPTTEMLNKQRDMLSNMQSEINALISVEDKIMKNRDDDLSHHIYTTPAFLLAFSFTCIAITVYAFLSIIRQTKKQQALELSEAKFRMLIKQAPVAIGIFKGEEAVIEIINDKARSLLGDDGEKNIGRSLFEVFPVTTAVRTMYEKVLNEGKPFAASDFRLDLDRNNITEDAYFDLLFEPLKGIHGEITSVIAVAAETTEKVTAYKKVEESEKHFRAIIENSIDAIVLADMNGIIRFVSASVKNIFGYDETELIGRMALELINPEDIPGLVKIAKPMIEKKQKAFSTVRFLHKDGTWRWVESTLSNMLDVPYINAFVCNVQDVTQQKNIQDTLKQSESNFRQLANLIPQIVWTAETNGYIDYYNKRWYEYTGLKEDDDEKSWIPILHPDDVQVCIDTWYHSVKTGAPYHIEYRFRDKARPNHYRWFLGKALPITNEEGEIVKWFGTCTDINDQKTITEKLEQLVRVRAAELTARNRDLNEAQSLAHIGSWEWDIKENKIFWSDELYRIFGIGKDNFDTTYESYTTLIYAEDRAYVNKIIEDAFQKGEAFDFYHRLKRPDGNMRVVHARGRVVINEEGEPERMTGTGQDITELIEIQNKLNELNETFNFAEQTSLIGSFRYNFSTGIFSNSDNLYRLLGCSPHEFEPTFENFISFIHPDDREDILSTISELNEAGISNEYLFRVIKKDGNIIHVRSTGIFITDNNEKIYIGALQDVTVQYNREMLLLEQNTTLEKMNNELASFSYIASHDLQEPLRKIKMFTHRLLEKEKASLSNEGKDYFNRIDKAAIRMKQLIEDLLSYSRTNTMQALFEVTDIGKLLEDVTDNLREKITQTNTVIRSSGLQSAEVIPFQFQQLLTNLITNSIKFTHKDVTPCIEISHTIINAEKHKEFPGLKKTQYHKFNISDNGIGFEPQYKEQIFGLFQRLHGSSEFEGTGIGLAICKKIAENHRGIITATSEIGRGATFTVYIPVNQSKNLN